MDNTIFIISDTYQLILALEWSISNNISIKVFNANTALKLRSTAKVLVYTIQPIDLYRTVSNVMHTLLTPDLLEFFRCMYDSDTLIHVFNNVELFFQKGLTDIHLHEAGEASYILSDRTGYYGEDDPFTVAWFHLTESIDDDPLKCKRMQHRPIFKKMDRELRKEICTVLNIVIPPVPGKNTILYVHNEPDEIRYTKEDIELAHKAVRSLLKELKDKGYTIWFKDHHKRPGRLPVSDIVDKIIDCPVEILDTRRFHSIVAVRSKCLEHILGNCYNGVTRLAVTHCRKNFIHVYLKGIEKIRKKVNNA